MIQKLDHCRLGVAGHGSTHALQKPIIAELSSRNSLIASVAGKLGMMREALAKLDRHLN